MEQEELFGPVTCLKTLVGGLGPLVQRQPGPRVWGHHNQEALMEAKVKSEEEQLPRYQEWFHRCHQDCGTWAGTEGVAGPVTHGKPSGEHPGKS